MSLMTRAYCYEQLLAYRWCRWLSTNCIGPVSNGTQEDGESVEWGSQVITIGVEELAQHHLG